LADPPEGPTAGSPATILLIEDDPQIRRFLQATLASQGYRLVEAPTGTAGLADAANRPPELVILDLGLPDMDGLEVIRRLREWTRIPIVILSARGQERDKIEALDAGADDYVSKPFGVGELLARVRVALRRVAQGGGEGDESCFAVGELRVDLAHRSVTVAGQAVHLTPIEYRLLAVLVRHPGKIVTHRQLLSEVWGPQHTEQAHYLRVYAGQLRRKLEKDSARPRYLLTEPGVGYRLAAE
jgi:two-component system KDP operon response regulator KdpE